MIQLPVGTKVWLAAGVTDLRRGFDGLSAQVQNVLHEQPFFEHVFVFRGSEKICEAVVVGWRRPLSLRQASGAGQVHLAEG
jgi:transposase